MNKKLREARVRAISKCKKEIVACLESFSMEDEDARRFDTHYEYTVTPVKGSIVFDISFEEERK